MTQLRTFSHFSLLLAALFLTPAAHSMPGPLSMSYYYDKDATLSFDEFIARVEAGAVYDRFDAAVKPLGRGDHWVVLMLERRETTKPNEWILEIQFPNIDRVEALVVYDNGVRDHFLIGDEVAFSQWPISYRQPSIPLRYLGSNDAAVYFRISSETPLIFPLKIITFAEQESIQKREHFLYGAFYGAIFILVLYNAGIYFSLRDRSYRYYILYILSFSVVQASTTGMGQQYLWPDYDGATTRIALFAMILTNYFIVHFVINFLDVGLHRPALEKNLRWLARIVLLVTPILLLPNYAYTQFFIHGLNSVSMLAVVITTLLLLGYNRRPALYLLFSYSVLFSAIIFATLFQANLIRHYVYIDYSMSIAILIEAVILSIGLSEKIARLRIDSENSERERRIAQEELSQQLIQTREHERAEMSKILHDSISHDLIVVRNKIGQMSTEFRRSFSSMDDEAAAIDSLLNKTISEIRNLSHLSHPQIVKHLGLEAALKALLKNSFDSTVSSILYIEDVPLSYDVQLFLYRAVQESITNVIKHAQASEYLIRLQKIPEKKSVRLVIRDDGSGFDAAPQDWGFGLRTLNEHCKLVSGEFRIESMPGEGTTLIIELPITFGEQFDG